MLTVFGEYTGNGVHFSKNGIRWAIGELQQGLPGWPTNTMQRCQIKEQGAGPGHHCVWMIFGNFRLRESEKNLKPGDLFGEMAGGQNPQSMEICRDW